MIPSIHRIVTAACLKRFCLYVDTFHILRAVRFGSGLDRCVTSDLPYIVRE